MDTRLEFSRDHRRIVDRLDGDERDVRIVVQPCVQLGRPQGEGGHRDAVEDALGVVGHLAGPVQAHEAGGEHLGVDAEAAQPPVREFRSDDVGDGTDAGLEGRPLLHVGQGVRGDRRVQLVGRRILQGERGGVRLDEQIDQVERNGVVVRRWQAPCARQVAVHLDDEQPLAITAGAQELVPGRPQMEGEVHVAGLVGRGALGGHDPGGEPGEDRAELPEAAGHQLDLVARVVQHPLGRSEEAAAVRHAGPGEDLVVVEAQGPADLQVLPVLARAERGEKGVGVGGPQAEPEAVDGPEEPDRLLGADDLGHGAHPRVASATQARSICPGEGAVASESMTFGPIDFRGPDGTIWGTPSSSQTTVLGEWRPPPSVAIFQFRSRFAPVRGPSPSLPTAVATHVTSGPVGARPRGAS